MAKLCRRSRRPRSYGLPTPADASKRVWVVGAGGMRAIGICTRAALRRNKWSALERLTSHPPPDIHPRPASDATTGLQWAAGVSRRQPRSLLKAFQSDGRRMCGAPHRLADQPGRRGSGTPNTSGMLIAPAFHGSGNRAGPVAALKVSRSGHASRHGQSWRSDKVIDTATPNSQTVQLKITGRG